VTAHKKAALLSQSDFYFFVDFQVFEIKHDDDESVSVEVSNEEKSA
jgi:hypothetical protein